MLPLRPSWVPSFAQSNFRAALRWIYVSWGSQWWVSRMEEFLKLFGSAVEVRDRRVEEVRRQWQFCEV